MPFKLETSEADGRGYDLTLVAVDDAGERTLLLSSLSMESEAVRGSHPAPSPNMSSAHETGNIQTQDQPSLSITVMRKRHTSKACLMPTMGPNWGVAAHQQCGKQ